MFAPLLASILAAILFYLLLPLAGAIRIRHSMKSLRLRLVELAEAPLLRYADRARAESRPRPSSADGESAAAELLGAFRFFGVLEAVEGDSLLWVRGEELTMPVEVPAAGILVLAPAGELPPWAPERAGGLESVAWKRVRVVPEGARIMVGGPVALRGGALRFVDGRGAPGAEPLLLVTYEAGESLLLPRLLAAARNPNEYWNPLARLSIVLGIGAASFLALVFSSPLPSLRMLAFLASIAPLLPLAPPGLAFYIAYRRLWRRGISLRVVRDLARLAGRGRPAGPGDAALPALDLGEAPGLGRGVDSGSGPDPARRLALGREGDPLALVLGLPGPEAPIAKRAGRNALAVTSLAVLALALSVALNYVLAFVLWRLLS